MDEHPISKGTENGRRMSDNISKILSEEKNFRIRWLYLVSRIKN